MSSRTRPSSLAQALMGSDSIIQLYESRLWRRNPFVALLMGITFEQEYQTILQAARLTGSETILDLACGPGTYAMRLAPEVTDGVVFGLDLVWPMLTYGKRRMERDGPSNVILLQGDASALPFSGDHFDVVNCCGALHLFANLDAVLHEINRVLKGGGRFTLAAYRKRAGRLSERVARLRRDLLGIDAFHPNELENRLRQAGFHEVQCHHARGIWLIMSATKAG